MAVYEFIARRTVTLFSLRICRSVFKVLKALFSCYYKHRSILEINQAECDNTFESSTNNFQLISRISLRVTIFALVSRTM